MYEMLNIVTGARGYPGAVLIRGTDSVVGPGRLTKFLHVTRAHNGKRAVRTTALWIEDRGVAVSEQKIIQTARIGVDYAGVWAKKKYRFVMK